MNILGLLLYVLFFFCLIKTIYNWIRSFVLRANFKRKLSKLSFQLNIKIKIVGGFWKSFFQYTSKPDVILKASTHTYVIRFVSCRARKRFYHFVTPEYYAKYMKLHFATLVPSRRQVSIDELGFRFGETAGYIPDFDEEYTKDYGNVKKILLFNPSPIVITCNCDGKKQIVGNGSHFYDYTIYTAKGFLDLLVETK